MPRVTYVSAWYSLQRTAWAETMAVLSGRSVQLCLLTGPSLLPHPAFRVGTSYHTPWPLSTVPSPNTIPRLQANCLSEGTEDTLSHCQWLSSATNCWDPRMMLFSSVTPIRQYLASLATQDHVLEVQVRSGLLWVNSWAWGSEARFSLRILWRAHCWPLAL